MRWRRIAPGLLALALLTGACGSDGGNDNATAEPDPTTTEAPTTTTAPEDPRLAEDETEVETLNSLGLGEWVPIEPSPSLGLGEWTPTEPTQQGTTTGQISGVELPQTFSCSEGVISIQPMRVYPANGGTEQVVWVLNLERWDGSAWVNWTTTSYVTTFGGLGQQRTAWTIYGSNGWAQPGPPYMQVATGADGDYRVKSGVVTSSSGAVSAGLLAGGDWCTMPAP
jgi:hypothetical protein